MNNLLINHLISGQNIWLPMDSLISHQAQKGVYHGVGPQVWFVRSHYYFVHKSAQNTRAGLLLLDIKKVEFESHPEVSPAGQSVACSHIFSSIHTWNGDWVQSTKTVPPPSNGKPCWAQPSRYSWKRDSPLSFHRNQDYPFTFKNFISLLFL